MNFLIRTDASINIGSGHVMRTLSIAEELVSRGHKVIYCSCLLLPELSEKIKNSGCVIENIDGEISSEIDKAQTLKMAKFYDVSGIIIDGYKFSEMYVKALNEHYKLTLIDDLVLFKNFPVDVIINANPSATPENYHHEGAELDLLLGPKYALIRNEFRSKLKEIPAIEDRKHILITFGGTDPANLTEAVLNGLLRRVGDDYVIDVVVREPLNEKYPDHVKVHQNCNYMADLMLKAGIAISAGGGTIGELAVMQVPTILIIVAENQEPYAKWASENQMHVVIDARKKANIASIVASEAVNLLKDDLKRKGFIEKCSKLVDGEGVLRIVDKIQNRVFC